jgi:plasmid stability protein
MSAIESPPADACAWVTRTRSKPQGDIILVSIEGCPSVANVLVRNLEADTLKHLKAAAKAHGRSLQAEIHDVLRQASVRSLAGTRRLSTRWLKRLRGSSQSDSAALIRGDRNAR